MQKIYGYLESVRQPADVVEGTVWTETLAQTTAPPMMVSRAHFAPGARTCWHEHAVVQTLIVESGVALVQEQGSPIEVLGAGQTVVCEPGVRHWHGAAPSHTMTQFAITFANDEGEYATWGQQVTDEEYSQFDAKQLT